MTGAARSVAVKLAYQSGFRAPLTVTLLYLLGQSLSLAVHWIQKCYHLPVESTNLSGGNVVAESSKEKFFPIHEAAEEEEDLAFERTRNQARSTSKGSSHGLNRESDEAISWVHFIPYYAKPIIPAFFNLLNSTLRWASLIYVAASIAEMLISGLELVLSVIATKLFRKRNVSRERWLGVGLVTVGIIIIGVLDYHNADERDESSRPNSSKKDVIVGIVLIICQSILSVLQDMSEEIFMQVEGSEFPATLMLGMEGAFGLLFGLILYFSCGESLGEDPRVTLQSLRDNRVQLGWVFGMPFLFLITGIFNIRATEVTSSMTRNVWKNLRTVLVWIFAIIVFYISGNDDVGEAWIVPDSFYVLFGFFVMTSGIILYYSRKQKEEDEKAFHKTSVHPISEA